MRFGHSAIPTPLGRSAASSPGGGVPPTWGSLQSHRADRLPVPRGHPPVRYRSPWFALQPSGRLRPRCIWTSSLRRMPALRGRNALSRAFLAMVRERRGEDLEAWMTEAMDSGTDALTRFARGLQEDVVAVKAGLTLEWSNGVTEGQIHRLKLIKRQGYERAGFALLRQRVLQVA